MSLNWVQVTAKPLAPVPLPDEKMVYLLESAEVVLDVPPTLDGPKWSVKATGKVWITSQRLVFAAPSAVSAAAADAPPPAHPTSATDARTAGADAGPADTLLGNATSYLSSFLPASAPCSHPPLHSLSLPLSSLSPPAFAQPLFGANHIQLSFAPSPGGGLPSASGVQVACRVFPVEGKGWEAFERLQRARVRAMERGEREPEVEALPVYPGRF